MTAFLFGVAFGFGLAVIFYNYERLFKK